MNIQKKEITHHSPNEKEYRALKQMLSSSDIRTYISSRKKFYKSVILREKSDDDDEDTVATTLGSIADCILTKSNLDDKYVLSQAGVSTGQVGKLVDELYKQSLKSINEEGVQTRSFEDLFSEAVNNVKYDPYTLEEVNFKGKNLQVILKLFTEPDKKGNVGEASYKEKLANIGKQVVSISMMQSGERIAQEMRESEYTRDVVNLETGNGIEVFYQLVIQWQWNDILMRSMLDKVAVDHNKKTIQPIDIKVTYDNTQEGFTRMYLKGLYIQAATYDGALREWVKQVGLEDYEILPMCYPVGDSSCENIPLLYTLTEDDIENAYMGFRLEHGHKHYMGLNTAIKEIEWHISTGNWKIDYESYHKGGILPLSIQYS